MINKQPLTITSEVIFVLQNIYNNVKSPKRRIVNKMTKSSTITMRVDDKLRRQAEILCEDMGLTLSTVYTMLLKAIVHTRTIPFKIQAGDPFYSDKNQEYLMESIRELDAGHGQEHELIDA